VQRSAGTGSDAAGGRVAELARAEASARGLDVLEVEVRGGRPQVVAVTVDLAVPDHGRIDPGDRPRDAVDIDVIADLSRALDAALVAGGVVADDATLEVSSPGVERPLVTAEDLVRNLGRDVELALDEDTIRGRLVAVEDERVGIVVDGTERQVALERVATARLVLPW
jgi:ribosome maturation factor RimP